MTQKSTNDKTSLFILKPTSFLYLSRLQKLFKVVFWHMLVQPVTTYFVSDNQSRKRLLLCTYCLTVCQQSVCSLSLGLYKFLCMSHRNRWHLTNTKNKKIKKITETPGTKQVAHMTYNSILACVSFKLIGANNWLKCYILRLWGFNSQCHQPMLTFLAKDCI